MYVGGLLDNVEQHANIDHNNDVDNHVNLGLAKCLVLLKYVLIFVTNRFLAMEHTKNPSIYLWKCIFFEQRYGYNSAIY